MLLSDLKGALRLLGDAILPLSLITLAVCAVVLVTMQLNPFFLASIAAALFSGGFLLILVWIIMFVVFNILLIEVFHHRSMRRQASEVPFRWMPKSTLVVSVCITLVMTFVLILGVSLLISGASALFLSTLLSSDGPGGGSTALFIGLAVWQLIFAVVLSFVVSRIALLPTISRRWDVGFGDAWRHQTIEFDPEFGKVRNRFFRAILALAVIQSVLWYVLSQLIVSLTGPGAVLMVVSSAVSMIFVGLFFALMAHLVHTHQPPVSDDGAVISDPEMQVPSASEEDHQIGPTG